MVLLNLSMRKSWTTRNGTINEGALEYFGGDQNPAIRQPGTDGVVISGSGVGGQYRANFDDATTADAATTFEAFADDLLGRDPAKSEIFAYRGDTNGGANTIQILINDEIVELNSAVSNGLATPDSLEFRWSGADVPGRQTTNNLDAFIEEMGALFDGTQLQDGDVVGFGTQNDAQLTGDDLNQVSLGSNGVDNGPEIWEFDNQVEAQNFLNFFNDVVGAFAML